MSEEEVKECLQSVAPTPAPVQQQTPARFLSQCDQGVLKAIIKLSVKRPELRQNKDVKHVLDRIKSNKKIEGAVWDRVVSLL